jgi:hypothetical protein
MKKLTRQDCLAANDLSLKEYEVKAWDGVVYLKKMTAKDQIDFEEMTQGKDKKNILTKLLVMCVSDEQGNKLFTEADIDALNNKSAAAVMEISNAILEANYMTNDDIEDLSKN